MQKDGSSVPGTDVELQIDPHQCHEVVGDYRALELTVPAPEIIRVFSQHRYRIFRRNPRGPLVNKTNREIRHSLEDAGLRRIFHLLNNGISAVCTSYVWEDSVVRIRDFQVVNGCQTTVTLWNARTRVRGDPSVLVNLRLIECPEPLHGLISRATNTQAALRAEDFVSTDEIQESLQRQFAGLSPPWLYEIKRGEWRRMLAGAERERYREPDGTFRWLRMKDVTTATLAFLGFPAEAKDRIRLFFGGRLPSILGEIGYTDVYRNEIAAPQLLLPALVCRRVNGRADKDKTDKHLQEVGVTDWLEHSRLHLAWLIGELTRNGDASREQGLPDRRRAENLLDSIDLWFEDLYVVARSALASSVSEARKTQRYGGHSEFFRSPRRYQLIREQLTTAVRLSRTLATEPFARLPR